VGHWDRRYTTELGRAEVGRSKEDTNRHRAVELLLLTVRRSPVFVTTKARLGNNQIAVKYKIQYVFRRNGLGEVTTFPNFPN